MSVSTRWLVPLFCVAAFLACGSPAARPGEWVVEAGTPHQDGGGGLDGGEGGSGSADGGDGGSDSDGGDGGGGDAGDDGGPADGGFDGGDFDGGKSDGGAGDGGGTDGGSMLESCFPNITEPGFTGPSYAEFSPVVGSHCFGTNHQKIDGIQRVVFLGDSVTVGSLPTLAVDYYRPRLAEKLAAKFNLDKGLAWDLWLRPNPTSGVTTVRSTGDFASCAKYGARTDDLLEDNSQVLDCLPESERHKRTLVVFTIGGNDIAALTKNGPRRSYEANRAETERFVQLLRETVQWFREDPARFPNGVFVVFANMYEFTDGTGDTSSCSSASLAGFEPWEHPEHLEELVIWANEQFMSIAVETGTDMIFMLEQFCGHGYRRDDPKGRCYRGPGADLWFDLTCIHPNRLGHHAIADMFMAVVEE